MPLALQRKVEVALDNLEAKGVIEKVKFSDWAAPIILVAKQDGIEFVGIISLQRLRLPTQIPTLSPRPP